MLYIQTNNKNKEKSKVIDRKKPGSFVVHKSIKR
jgi:hypothetical protein